jgi:hypothetical protein
MAPIISKMMMAEVTLPTLRLIPSSKSFQGMRKYSKAMAQQMPAEMSNDT